MKNEFSKALIREIPLNQFPRMFEGLETSIDNTAIKGGICGGGCGDSSGLACGVSCTPGRDGFQGMVIDPDGKLGLTMSDLEDIRKDIPALKDNILEDLQTEVLRIQKLKLRM